MSSPDTPEAALAAALRQIEATRKGGEYPHLGGGNQNRLAAAILAAEPRLTLADAVPDAERLAGCRSQIAALLNDRLSDGWNYGVNAALDVVDATLAADRGGAMSTRDPLSPQWEDCKVCGGDHWTKDHPDLRLPPEKQRPMPPDRIPDAVGDVGRLLNSAVLRAQAAEAEITRLRAVLERLTSVYERPAGRGKAVEHLIDEGYHEIGAPCFICDALGAS